MKRRNEDQPWVSNYPVLQAFLHEHGGRCDWQLRHGGTEDAPQGFVEQWRFRGGGIAHVVVHERQGGWDIFTPSGSNSIQESLRDAAVRLGLDVDAKLHAAAPKLLAVVREWVEDPPACVVRPDKPADDQARCDCWACTRLRDARAALDAAIGGAP